MAVKIKKWVLVVDDEDGVRESISRTLANQYPKEVKIVEARDGLEASAKVANQTFHLIITDIRMPRKDGEELIEGVREGGFNENTPIIATSAYVDYGIEKKYPFVSYLPKPIENEKLLKMVDTYFKLESTEKMIEGSIFSSLLDSSIDFLKEALSRDDFDVGEMVFKKRGIEVVADHAAVIKVQVGNVFNTFSVLCSKKTLEELRGNLESIAGSSLEVICRSLGFVILKRVLTECGIVDSNEVDIKNVSEDPSVLSDKQGIIVPINAINVDYKIFATTSLGSSKAEEKRK